MIATNRQFDAAEFERYTFPGGYSPADTAGPCEYDATAAQKAIDFFPRFLVHIKGELAGKPLYLERWQAAIIATLFGWKRVDGTRRYRMAYIEIPRKNGKSTLSAGIALLFLYMDDEPGAEIYSAASDRDQAAIVFELAKENVLRRPSLEKRSKVYRSSIVSYDKGAAPRASYKVLSSDAKTKHGYNPSVIVADELHAHPNRELWDVLNTGTGARREPLTVAITTAGYDKHSICYEQHEYAEKIRDGIIEDRSFLPVIYAAAAEDDWKSPDVWEKANPNLGVSVSREFLAAECKKAQESPAYENTFRRLYLDQWTEQDVRWLSMDKWDACNEAVSLEDHVGKQCYAALDLGAVADFTALVLIYKSGEFLDVFPFFWIAEEGMQKRVRRDRVKYDHWVRDGLIRVTPGSATDYDAVRRDIYEIFQKHPMLQLGIDTLFQGHQLAMQLMADGINVSKFGQGFMSMASPTKRLEELVLTKRIRHGGNPVLRWMASNVTVKQDPAGNLKPDKEKSSDRIDGIVSLIMAIGLLMGSEGESYYENNRLLVV